MTPIVRQLETRMVEKVWGRIDLPAPFKAPEQTRIGEIWFKPPPEMPDLLVKYLFTGEKLSVQVHPSTANAMPGEAGKEECWLVLDAEPGAQLAIGFKQSHAPERIEAAARDGSIEQLLCWHDAAPGDVYYLPAGTVHAIGPGLALVEVQQNSDTTFRLYDYGRPRQLHLGRAMAVAQCGPYGAEHKGTAAQRGQTLIDGAHFRLDRIEGAPDAAIRSAYSGAVLALPLTGQLAAVGGDGSGSRNGGQNGGQNRGQNRGQNGGARARAGECVYANNIDAIDFSAAGVTLLTRTS
jgi:mannose-6-phosphate isomerase